MFKVKLFGFIPIDLMWVVLALIDALKNIADGFVVGEDLSRDQKKLTRTLYYLAEERGLDAAKTTETPLDDESIADIIDLCKDTAEEGAFQLPIVPEDV